MSRFDPINAADHWAFKGFGDSNSPLFAIQVVITVLGVIAIVVELLVERRIDKMEGVLVKMDEDKDTDEDGDENSENGGRIAKFEVKTTTLKPGEMMAPELIESYKTKDEGHVEYTSSSMNSSHIEGDNPQSSRPSKSKSKRKVLSEAPNMDDDKDRDDNNDDYDEPRKSKRSSKSKHKHNLVPPEAPEEEGFGDYDEESPKSKRSSKSKHKKHKDTAPPVDEPEEEMIDEDYDEVPRKSKRSSKSKHKHNLVPPEAPEEEGFGDYDEESPKSKRSSKSKHKKHKETAPPVDEPEEEMIDEDYDEEPRKSKRSSKSKHKHNLVPPEAPEEEGFGDYDEESPKSKRSSKSKHKKHKETAPPVDEPEEEMIDEDYDEEPRKSKRSSKSKHKHNLVPPEAPEEEGFGDYDEESPKSKRSSKSKHKKHKETAPPVDEPEEEMIDEDYDEEPRKSKRSSKSKHKRKHKIQSAEESDDDEDEEIEDGHEKSITSVRSSKSKNKNKSGQAPPDQEIANEDAIEVNAQLGRTDSSDLQEAEIDVEAGVEEEKQADGLLIDEKQVLTWRARVAVINFFVMVLVGILLPWSGRFRVLWNIAPHYSARVNTETEALVYVNIDALQSRPPTSYGLIEMGCEDMLPLNKLREPRGEDDFSFLLVHFHPDNVKGILAAISMILGLFIYFFLQIVVAAVGVWRQHVFWKMKVENELPENFIVRTLLGFVWSIFFNYFLFLLIRSQQSLVLAPLTQITPTEYCLVVDSPTGLSTRSFIRFYMYSIAGIPVGVPMMLGGLLVLTVLLGFPLDEVFRQEETATGPHYSGRVRIHSHTRIRESDDSSDGSIWKCLGIFFASLVTLTGVGLFGCWLLLGFAIGPWIWVYTTFISMQQVTTVYAELSAPSLMLLQDMIVALT